MDYILLIVITYLTSFFLYAQETVWEQTNGPYSGIPNKLYATQKDLLFVVSDSGLFRSSDNGLSWAKVNNGLNELGNLNGLIGPSIIVKPFDILKLKNGNLLIASNYKGKNDFGQMLYLSSANGDSWMPIMPTWYFQWKDDMRQIAIDSVGNIYVVEYSGPYRAIWKSTDNGVNWLVEKDFSGEITVTSSGVILVFSKDKVFRSFDNGETFDNVPKGISSNITAIASLPNNIVLVGTENGNIYRSIDNGKTWQNISTGLIGAKVISIVYSNIGDSIFASTNNGIFVFNSDNISWSIINDKYKRGILFYNQYTRTLFVFNDQYGLYKSGNGGQNFGHVTFPVDKTIIKTLLITANGNILAGSNYFSPGVFLSENNGDDWEIKDIDPIHDWSSRIYGFGVINPGLIFAVGDDSYETLVSKSSDHGDSWSREGFPIAGQGWLVGSLTAIATDENQNIYVYWENPYGPGSIYMSSDRGNHFNEVTSNGLTNKNILDLLVTTNSSLFAATDGGGIYRLPSGGNQWAQINNGLTSVWVTSLIQDHLGRILAGTNYGGGLFYSEDNGDHWTQMGLKGYSILSLAINDQGHIYAGTDTSGVFESINDGLTWRKISSGLPKTSINTLAISQDGYVFAGTDSGVYRTRLNIATNINNDNNSIPVSFILHQNYPNPFNPTTTIEYEIPKATYVKLEIYNTLGQRVRTLVNENKPIGQYQEVWDGRNDVGEKLGSGIYFYILKASKYQAIRKMLFIQ